MKVILKKICVSEHGNQTCKHQGTNNCHGCAINSGQKFHSFERKPIKFKGVPISALLKRLLYGD